MGRRAERQAPPLDRVGASQRFAAQAARKADARRDKADGAAGWVADRAGEWTLEWTSWRGVAGCRNALIWPSAISQNAIVRSCSPA